MLRTIIRVSPGMLSALLPMDLSNYDKISKDSKTAKDFYTKPKYSETGLDRLYLMFTIDEFGKVSPELNQTYTAGFTGFLFGAVYGGFIRSRVAYLNFMDTNQATAFASHLDAKKKLQDTVTLNFAKGAFRWGWRLALFTTSYVGITTMISVYRGESSIWEYLVAGCATGAVYKINLGLRGIISGSVFGGIFGGIAGCISLLLLKVTGTSMEEVRYWQYKWRDERDQTIAAAYAKQKPEEHPLVIEHEDRLGTKQLTLDNIDKNVEITTK